MLDDLESENSEGSYLESKLPRDELVLPQDPLRYHDRQRKLHLVDPIQK